MSLQIRVKPRWPVIVEGTGGITVERLGSRAIIGFDYANSELGIELADAVSSATDSMNAAAGSASDAAESAVEAAASASAIGAVIIQTVSAAGSTEIGESTDYLSVQGYSDIGDGGGGLYVRAGSEPSHPAKFQSADGAWWELTGRSITAEMLGALEGSGQDGLVNASALNNAITYLDYRGGGELLVRAGTYIVGDASTTNTCIRMRSNIVLRHEPGVVYIHKALGRQSPESTDLQSAPLARQNCFFQLDGCEDGPLENYAILGHPKIDGQNTTPIRRGVNMYGEHNNFTIEVWGANLRDMLLTWGDDDDFRYSKGENGAFSLKYTGSNAATGTLYEMVNLFPKADRSGRPGVRHIRFYDTDIDATNGVTNNILVHGVACIKLNNCEDVEFGPRVKLRGGTVGCLTVTNGTMKVRGSVDTGDSPVGVVVSDASNSIALDSLTGYVDLDVQHSGVNGTDRCDAVVVQGACPGVNVRIQSENGGLEFWESDFPTFGLSGVATSTATVNISIASPGVITWTAHGLSITTPIIFATTGTLPSGLLSGKTYWVKTVLSADTFTVSGTLDGTVITTTGTQSGTHTATTHIAKGVTLTASGGATGTVQGVNADGTKLVMSRAGLDSIAAGETFATQGVTGTIATVYEPDGLVGGRFTGYVRRGWLHMEQSLSVRNPIRDCYIDFTIDGVGLATASQCDTGSPNWYMRDSDITLRFVNPPTFPMSNYGKNNRISVSSDGVGSNVSTSALFREFGTGTVLDALISSGNTKHSYLYSIETGGSQLTLRSLAAPSTIKRKSVSTGSEVTLGNRMVRADFTLSSASYTQALQPISYPCWITGVQIVYPDGTTADTGVALQFGTLASITTALNVTSDVSQAAGAVVNYTQTGSGSSTLKEALLTGGTLAVRCAGSKVNADRAVILIHIADVMPVS